MTVDLPQAVQALIGVVRYEQEADNEVSLANIRAMCAAVENSNLQYWCSQEAQQAPATMLSTWGRPELWSPGEGTPVKALQLHFDLKTLFDFPTAIVGSFESVFHSPVKVGDRLRTRQILQSVSEEKDTRLGRGRFWVIEMQYYNQRDELLGVDSFNCFGYRRTDS